MLRITELKLPLDHAPDALRPAICQRLGIANDDLLDVSLFRRGYDARKKSAITLIYTVDCTLRDEAAVFKRLHGDRNISPTPDMAYKMVAQAPAGFTERPIVIGMGPCGFMAALLLAQMGFRPIVLERGKIVRERTKDTWGLWRKNTLNPESNVQFGEGGAGTFSDGKLYSQIKDPNFYGRKVLEEFVKAGAPEEIIYVSKPHVGTFRLVKMVENIRHNIVELGGEIRFEAKVDKLLREDGQVALQVGHVPQPLPAPDSDLELAFNRGSVHSSQPILLENNEVADMRWGMSTQTLLQTSQQAKRDSMIVAFIGILISGVLAVTMGMNAASRLRRIGEASQALVDGDYGMAVPVEGPEEFRRLAKHFNHMSATINSRIDQLKQSQYELASLNEALEFRVEERTAALIEAGRVRLRPILMTTFAMVFGMMPLALAMGEGSEQRAPMAHAVIGGVITSTMLTLIVVPVVFTYLDSFGAWVKRKLVG